MKKILAAVGTFAVASSLGGCITQTGFHWSDDKPKKDETVKGILDLKTVEPVDIGGGPAPTEVYYFLKVVGISQDVAFRKFKFDPDEVLGPSVKMTEDPNIATFASANCAPGAVGDETSYRTEDPVPAESLDKVFDVTFKADVGPKGSGFAGAVQSGQWYDDGDGAAEDPGPSDDDYECTGFASTVLSTKGFAVQALSR